MFKNISWRYKIWGISLVPLIACVFIGGLSALFLTSHSSRTAASVNESLYRSEQAGMAERAVANLDQTVKLLVAVDKKADIREKSVGTIRAAAYLEEAIVKLEDTLQGDERVTRLVALQKATVPERKKLIGLARKNADEEAVVMLDGLLKKSAEIRKLSLDIMRHENEYLKQTIGDSSGQASTVSTVILAATSLAIFLSIIITMASSKRLFPSDDERNTGTSSLKVLAQKLHLLSSAARKMNIEACALEENAPQNFHELKSENEGGRHRFLSSISKIKSLTNEVLSLSSHISIETEKFSEREEKESIRYKKEIAMVAE